MKCSLLTLSGYLDDELDAERRAEVDAHLVGCERCRNGLDCLREETDRFSALGRVHVPDGAIHGFLAQLGLVDEHDILPPRRPRRLDALNPDLPPWMGGGGAGGALPWLPRGGGDRPDANQPSLPFTDSLTPGVALAPPLSRWPVETELDLNGRSMAGSTQPRPVAPPVAASVTPSPSPTAATEPPEMASPPSPSPLATPQSSPPLAPPAPMPSAPRAPVPGISGPGLPPARPWPEPVTPPSPPPAAAVPPLAGYRRPDQGPDRPAEESIALEGVSTWPAPRGMRPAAAGAARSAVPEELDGDWSDAFPPPPPSSDASEGSVPPPARLSLPTTPLPIMPPPPPVAPAVPPLPRPAAPALPPLPRPFAPPPAASTWPPRPAPPPPSPPEADEDPWSWAPIDDARPPLDPRTSLAPLAAGSSSVSIPGADAGRAVGGSRRTDDSAEPLEMDTISDPVIDPLIARVVRPPQLVHPTLISRLRDQVALRLALMRGAGASDVAEPSPRSPQPSSRPQPPESVGPLVAAARPPSHLPGEPEGAAPRSAWDLPAPDRSDPRLWTDGARRMPTIAEELPRTEAPPRGRGRDLPWKPGRHTRHLGSRSGRLAAAGGSVAQMAQRFGELPHHVRRLAAHPRRRWYAVAAVAVLALVVILVIARPGAGTANPQGGAAATLPRTSSSSAPLTQPSASLHPSASSAPTASVRPSASAASTATPAPTPVPTPALPAAQTYGSGGTGWQLQDVRCCHVQEGTAYTRIVFDLGGSSTSNPTATVSYSSPTTMLISLPGVTAPTSFSIGAGGGLVTGVTRESGSQLVFRVTLSSAATVKGYDFLPPSAAGDPPLRLYFDLG